MAIIKSVSFNTNKFSSRINELKRRINNGFDVHKYGYAELLRSCQSISVADPECVPQFMMLPQNRDLSYSGANGGSFDCQESSLIIKSWADEIGLRSSLNTGIMNGNINHVFLNVPGWGIIGATPYDKGLDHKKLIAVKPYELSESDIYNDPNAMPIFLTHPVPMMWFRAPRNIDVYVFAGMDLQGETLGELFRNKFMAINIVANIFKGDKKHEYICRLVLKRNQLRFLKQMAEQNGKETALKIFRQAEFRDKHILMIEQGQIKEDLISAIQINSESILFNLLSKIEPWIPALLEDDPNALKPID